MEYFKLCPRGKKHKHKRGSLEEENSPASCHFLFCYDTNNDYSDMYTCTYYFTQIVVLFYGLAIKYSYLGALKIIVRLHELT